MTALGLAARWVHLASCLSLVGGAALLLLAGRSDRPTAQAWFGRVLIWSRAFALVAIVSGCVALAGQAAMLESRPIAGLDLEILRRVVLDSGKSTKQEVLFKGIGRVRDVVSGPDGLVYVAFNGPDRVARLVPATP